MLLFNELDIRLIIWCASSFRCCERKRGQQQDQSYNHHETLALPIRPSFIERRYSSCLKSRYTHSFTFTIIPKHPSCTQPHASPMGPTPNTKTSKAGICRATTTQAREPCSCTMTSHGSRTRSCVQPGCRSMLSHRLHG